MRLSISNIAWRGNNDLFMYEILRSYGYQGLEIAPTRIFMEHPYSHRAEAKHWATELKNEYGLKISSIQSIWYGRQEKIFETENERRILVNYTKKAILFAESIGCKNIVFGCPRNRDTDNITGNMSIAIDFFKELGDYAIKHNTIVAIEANPLIYNTRFINTTEQAVELIYKVSSEGVKLNVDLGTIIYNKEDIRYLRQVAEVINHIHISEPNLNIIERRDMHKQLFALLKDIDYQHFVSIEMGNKDSIEDVVRVLEYVKSLNV
ncbi:sugar phosphate isomerase/epimerase [Bacteroides sp.]|jgi:sugar phosphate isomerase/epimerase|uniref:sugar phosphate isomerase/epimerase family protein n=1 Tax=Bacteroides sp. TaxID=29523 RepID=UPI002584A94C|nr:sugar phosphate isomerase/epimerase [Bacteroides sp.]